MGNLQQVERWQYPGQPIPPSFSEYDAQLPVNQFDKAVESRPEPARLLPVRDEEWDGTGTAFQCDVALAGVRSRGVLIPEPARIRGYLLDCPDMIDLLEPVCEAVLARFPRPSQVALELFRDPESDDQYLTVYVRQDRYEEDIVDRLDKVSRQFDDILCQTSGWILITTDFQDPI